MKKGVYVWIFVAVLVGLAMGLTISSGVNTNQPWHPLQQISTNSTGESSVDFNNNDIIDKSDTVIDISQNIQMPYAFNTILAPPGPGNNLWMQLPAGALPAIPPTADYAIIHYQLTANPGAGCTIMNLDFAGSPGTPNPATTAIAHVSHGNLVGVSSMEGQAIVPLIPGTGKFWFRWWDGTGAPNTACNYVVYLVGYLD